MIRPVFLLLASVACPAIAQAQIEESRFGDGALALENAVLPPRVLPHPPPPPPPEQVIAPVDDGAVPRIEYELTLGLISDLRRGGVSLSGGRPAAQAELTVSHPSGLGASVWAATVADNGAADIEVDLSVGYGFAVGGTEMSVSLIGYLYPGVPDSAYYELEAAISRKVGSATVAAVVAYSPRQANLGDQDNLYAGIEFEMPLKRTALSFSGAIGLENGAAGNYKVDWRAGATYDFKVVKLGLDYVDTARAGGIPDSGSTVSVSAVRTF